MEQGNTLIVQPMLTPSVWQMIEAVAPTIHLARIFNVANKEQAAAIMLKGYELGLSLSGSFEYIQIVMGRPTLSPRGALALIMNSPLCESVKIEDLKDANGAPRACRVAMKRKGGFEYVTEFSMEDAQRAGVVKPDSGWQSYPANMLRWRAVGFCADVVFPDVIGGMKRADELGANITPDGDVVEGQWQNVTTPQPAPANPNDNAEHTGAQLVPSLSWLVDHYGPQAVMDANNGAIPSSDKEVRAVARKLEDANA